MMAEEKLQEMSFWDHIDALRSVLIRIVIVLVVMTLGLFFVMPTIFDKVILAPCHGDFVLYRLFERMTSAVPWLPQFSTQGFEVELINIKLASQFFIHMSSSFWLALVLTFPIMLYLLWTFIAPALYPGEKRGVKTAFFIGCMMFFLGVAVGYYVVFPVTLRFLADYHVSQLVPNQISLDSYMDTFLMLIFVMGIIFELPLVAWLLGNLGVLNRGFFRAYRRHAVVVLLVLAAIITPTGDPFTLMVVFLPIYLLYEVSAYLVPRATA
jgi:sec-independent protein translocase protein TatC